jgi:beta-lactamase superfamily II metal-dependent hydrolase
MLITKKTSKHHKIQALFFAMLLLISTLCSGCGQNNDAVTQSGTAQEVETVTKDSNDQSSVAENASANVDGQPETTSTTSVLTSGDTTLTITCLKAGAADAFILMTEDHVTIIDTGLDSKSDRLLNFLNEQGVTRIDEMIITHFDKDHVGGADHVLDNFEVGTVYTTYHSKVSDDITNYLIALKNAGLQETEVSEVTSFHVGDISFTIYPPARKKYSEKTSNNSSIVIKVTLGENSMLFAGDAEAERIEELLATEDLQSTILKVPHHGRYAENSAALIEYVNPEYAIITSSKSDPEDQEVLDILAQNSVTTYLTRDGTITIEMTSTDITITQ